MNGLNRLKEGCDMSLSAKKVLMPNGSYFEYWSTPLTVTERARAEKAAGAKAGDNDNGIQILIAKASDEKGQPLFTQADVFELKNRIPAAVLTELMVQIITDGGRDEGEEVEADVDPKGSKESSAKTKS